MTHEEAFLRWLEDHRIPYAADHGLHSCSGCGAQAGEQHTLACPHKDNRLPTMEWLDIHSSEQKRLQQKKESAIVKKAKAVTQSSISVKELLDAEIEKLDLYEGQENPELCRKCKAEVDLVGWLDKEPVMKCPQCGYRYRVTMDTKKCGCCGKTKMEGCDCLNEKNKKTKGDPCNHCDDHEGEHVDCNDCRANEIMDKADANKKCYYCSRTRDGGCNCDEDGNEETNGDVCEACEILDASKECEDCLHD